MTTERLTDGQAFGISALTDALDGVQFPITRQDLIRQYGTQSILWTQSDGDTLENLLGHAEQDEFYSITDVVSAISRPGH